LQKIHAVDPLTGEQITADHVFLDWAITNYLMDPSVGDGRYSYTTFASTPRSEPTENVHSCPIGELSRDVHQYGVDYIRFMCRGSFNLHFSGSTQTHLLPQDPHSGQYAFWSNQNDESDTVLTKTFDLSSVSGHALLTYWTWYDVENGWDYVYLEASTDGDHWQILKTPSGTSYDPQGFSYGWGYTGASGGGAAPTWIQETVDLSQFAGQSVTLRFEYVTDSSVTGEGFMLDDLAIPEINYFTDFEADLAGWQAAGWARVQGVVPQSFRLALISTGDTTSVNYIALDPHNSIDIPFTIGDGVDNVVLVVSGTTRYTRQLAPYIFSVTKP
jgi:hypothetical protein